VKPLDGIRVIDLTMYAFVPAAGGVLAHWGADVIKIEPPDAPDPMRLAHNGSLEPGDAGWMFKHYSRGKRSLTLNLKAAEGREILYRLVREADVFLTSFLPATRQKLGFDVDVIREVNPDIVYVRGSGYGPRGPHAGRGGYDSAAWWFRGSLADSARDATGVDRPPWMVGHGDGMSGMTLAGGICAGLLQRSLTGIAPVIDGSLLGTAVWYNGPSIIASGLGGHWPEQTKPHADRLATLNEYRTRDGRFLHLVMLDEQDRDWADLCQRIGHPELVSDPRFSSGRARRANQAEGVKILDAIFAERTLGEWKEALESASGVWAPVQTSDEIFDDPQVQANGFIRPVEYPTGTVRLPAPPILFDEEAGDPPPAPDFGQHTDDILAMIGLDQGEIDRLRAAGVVR
jgi:crotonobetainyl-CoA:carnitine CoA-transferase CaiB-like acyl-CoA transferase